MPTGSVVGQIFVEIRAVTSRLRGDLTTASSLIRDWSLVATGMGDSVTQAFTSIANIGMKAIQVGAIAVAGSFTLMAVEGAKFEDEMVRTFTIIGAGMNVSASTMVDLTDTARVLGRETLFSATQAAQGMQILARSGFGAREVIRTIRPVLNMAIVGNLQMAESSSIAVTAMRSFELSAFEASRVVDVLSVLMSRANTDIRMAGEALSYVGAIAHSAGMSLEEAGAAIGVISDGGVQASRAGTGLRAAIAKLLAPSKEAQKILNSLGVSAITAAGELRPLANIIDDLNRAGVTTEQVFRIFGRRAATAMAVLLKRGGGALRRMQKELEYSTGAAERMSQKFRTTVKGRVLDLIASIKDFGLSFSENFKKPLSDAIFAIRNFIVEIVKVGEGSKLFKAIMEGVALVLSNLFGFMKDGTRLFTNFIGSLRADDIRTFFDGLATQATSWSNMLKSAFKEVGDRLRVLFKGINFEMLIGTAIRLLPNLVTLFGFVFSVIVNVVNISAKLINLWNSLPTPIKVIIGWIAKTIAIMGLVVSAITPIVLAIITWKVLLGLFPPLLGAIIFSLKSIATIAAVVGAVFGGWKLGKVVSQLKPIEDIFTKIWIIVEGIVKSFSAIRFGQIQDIIPIIRETRQALADWNKIKNLPIGSKATAETTTHVGSAALGYQVGPSYFTTELANAIEQAKKTNEAVTIIQNLENIRTATISDLVDLLKTLRSNAESDNQNIKRELDLTRASDISRGIYE